jgi:6-phosphofructokinase
MSEAMDKYAKAMTKQKIGVVFCGYQAPGCQNVIDGLIRYKMD